ncbi:MAG: DUF4399 domain-containing protein [Colwellia sp.]|nr:DUF4399 domain-containing protein [Colwellia sp.]
MKKHIKLSLLALVLSAAVVNTSFAHNKEVSQAIKPSSAPANASVYIISPQDGSTVEETFAVTFGLQGMGVSPAGVEKSNTGHHHLLVDGKRLPVANKPMGGEVTHFGGGQTQTEITLDKGEHTLQLILGDHRHIPHSPAVMSKKITITVK